MKRWQYILVMSLVAAGGCGLVWWAGSFHGVRGEVATTSDRIISASAFWGASALPILVGTVLSLILIKRVAGPLWPVLEAVLIGLALFTPVLPWDRIMSQESAMFVVAFVADACEGWAVLNICSGVRHAQWAKAARSVLPLLGGAGVSLAVNSLAMYFQW